MAVSAAHAALAAGWRLDAAPRATAAAQRLTETVCLTYAQLLFSRSPAVGALVLLAPATAPAAALAGVASVLLALATASALGLPPEQRRSGQLSYNALMVGLALSALTPPSPFALGVLVVAVVASVLVTAALHLALGVGHGLPVLTLPFLAVFYLTIGALPQGAAPLALSEGGLLASYLQALGSILCAPRVDAGLLVLAALLLHSRIAAALSLSVFALAFHLSPALAPSLGLNAMLVAMALGAVWFIPGPASYAIALAGSLVSGALGLGLAARFERLGLPILIVPFNLTVPLVLYVMRQRVSDGGPHAVDFAPGTPEQNLAYFHSRRERFGAVRGVRFTAPFRGRWTCTQGVSGGLTHEGVWRHALDFEVLDADGRSFSGEGSSLEDYSCYRLPVTAPAAGVVARVIDGVPDNPVGEVNLDDNWGNVVIVYHAPGVYSCLAHLAPGSARVREGDPVAVGDVLALCGNSGRSATPHLHLQLQASADVGAATIPIELHDVVEVSASGELLHAARVPTRGEVIRRVEADDERALPLRFGYGEPRHARYVDGRRERSEQLTAGIDLLGRCVLRSESTDAVLYYEHTPSGFTVHDVVGVSGSSLHLLRVALSRVPFDASSSLRWSDRLPLRPFLPVWLRALYDVVSPLGAPSSLSMTYSARREGASLLVEGRSDRSSRDGSPWVVSAARLSPGVGLVSVDVRVRGRRQRVDLSPVASPVEEGARITILPTERGTAHV